MFNVAQHNSRPQEVWKGLGTYYYSFSKDQKGPVEDYWESLARTVKALYYELAEMDNQRHISQARGYVQLLHYPVTLRASQPLYISNPSGLTINASQVGSVAPSKTFKVTAFTSWGETMPSLVYTDHADESHTELTWNEVQFAEGYKIYASGELLAEVTDTTFTFAGPSGTPGTPPAENTALAFYEVPNPQNFILLYASSIEIEGETLLPRVDFYVHEHSRIRIKPDKLLGEEGSIPELFVLDPSLSHFYFPLFGAAKEVLVNKDYLPPISSWECFSDRDRMIAWAKHFHYLAWALAYHIKQRPTVANIKRAYAVVRGHPFCYKAGVVDQVDLATKRIWIAGHIYYVPFGTIAYEAGEYVPAFYPLIDGIEVKDWLSHPAYMEGLDTDSFRSTVELEDTIQGYFWNEAWEEQFIKTSLPAGLTIIKSNTPFEREYPVCALPIPADDLPDGYSYLMDEDGNFILDEDEDYLLGP